MIILNFLSIVLFAAGLSKIFTNLLIIKLNVNLFNSSFSSQIPGFTPDTALIKTNDILYATGIFIFSAGLFFVYRMFAKSSKPHILNPEVFNLIYAILLLLQTHFVRHSGTEALIYFILSQCVYIYLNYKNKNIKNLEFNWLVCANGILMGFFVMLFVRRYTGSMIFTIGTIVIVTQIYQNLILSKLRHFLVSPLHLLFFLAIFFSWNTVLLILLLAVVLIGTRFIKLNNNSRNIPYLYLITLLLYLSYNPTFYFGNLDSVEEGFWFGWLQRLLMGQILYSDVMVYHPPLIPWMMGLFVKLFGENLYTARLYFQILKVIGILLIFISVQKLIPKKTNLFLTLLIILSFLTTLVRNNVEIRLGIGLFSLYLFSKSLDGNKKWIAFAGLVSGISLFVSLESGIASIAGILIGIFVANHNLSSSLLKIKYYFSGLLIPLSVVSLILHFQGAFKGFVAQTYFYSKAFAYGYFNNEFDAVELENIFQFWVVNRFLRDLTGVWIFTFISIAFVLVYLLKTYLDKKSNPLDLYAVMVFCFNLVLVRVALGRSDWYHLLFILINTIVLLVYVLEILKAKVATYTLIFLIIVMFRVQVAEAFINDQLIRLQSYANVPQSFNILQTSRSGIALNIDAPVNAYDRLIKYISDNTTPDESIFVYPWKPELYFLTDRNNATKFDTPYSFFTEQYQIQMIDQIKVNNPKFIVYNSNMNFAGMTPSSLPMVKNYIENNYNVIEKFGDDNVMTLKQ